MAYQDRLLGAQEHVLRRAHRHVIFVILHTLPMVFGGVLLWVAAFLTYRYVSFYPGIIALVLLLGSLVPLGIATYRFLWWKAEEYLVTNFRILQVEGILSKRSLDSSLGRINDVEMRQSMFGRMFGYGDIYILTGSSHAINDLMGIDQPFHFKQALLEAKTQFEGLVPDTRRSTPLVNPAHATAHATGSNHQTNNVPAETINMDDTSRIDNAGRILAALSELRNSGVISEDEYQEKVRKVTGT